MSHLDEIKSRISIEELVGGYVQLKKAGRNFKGLCPFHSEKTPSFVVSPEKEIAYCFGCNKGGDIFKFTQLVENVDFGEALKMLAERANVTLPRAPLKAHSKRMRTVEANGVAVDFFVSKLSEKHKKYFLDRGLTDETIKTFKLGYAPDSFDGLKTVAKQQDFSESELLEEGLLNQRSMADKSSYDRFRNRLIFPIFDHQGNAIGFGGRIIGEGEPKYLNSPDTPAYNKSTVLYGLNLSKDAIKEADMAIFVEGYMDVIASYQAGIKNVVASSGTAVTPQQLKLIKRYTKNVALAFDKDSAGMDATMRAIELAQEAELNIFVIDIPEGKDPDECIQKSVKIWQNAAKKPVTVMDFYFAYAESKFNKDSVEGKKSIMNLLLPIIKTYDSEVEQGIYLNRLALELKTDVKLLWNDLKNTKFNKVYAPYVKPDEESKKEDVFSREMFLLGFIFSYPSTYEYVHNNLIDISGAEPDTEVFYKACKKVYTEVSHFDPSAVKSAIEPEKAEKIDIFQLLIEENYPDFPEEMAKKEAQKLVREINRSRLRIIQKECEFQLRSATTTDEKKILLNKYNEILKLTTKIK